LQTQALGTALKILFADSKYFTIETLNSKQNTFQLTRPEIVALVNGFARLSTSVMEVENFRELFDRKSSKLDL
jgi:ERO1-like protein beta